MWLLRAATSWCLPSLSFLGLRQEGRTSAHWQAAKQPTVSEVVTQLVRPPFPLGVNLELRQGASKGVQLWELLRCMLCNESVYGPLPWNGPNTLQCWHQVTSGVVAILVVGLKYQRRSRPLCWWYKGRAQLWHVQTGVVLMTCSHAATTGLFGKQPRACLHTLVALLCFHAHDKHAACAFYWRRGLMPPGLIVPCGSDSALCTHTHRDVRTLHGWAAGVWLYCTKGGPLSPSATRHLHCSG